MTQQLLPFKYEEEKKEKNLTGLGGLLLFLDLFAAMKLDSLINRHMEVKKSKQGYRDDQILISLILLNIAGGESISDIQALEKDEGFCQILKSMELQGKTGRIRERIHRRWRKVQKNTVASPSSIFRYLLNFHNPTEELKREAGKAFIPKSNEHLRKFADINNELVHFVNRSNPETQATLDMDATLAQTYKKTALFSYKGYRAYQPFNVRWSEKNMLLYTEFRDGNVPAGHEQLRVLKESLNHLPESVEEVYVRSDSAGYQHELMKYCDMGNHPRFGRIRFAISSDITQEFKKSILLDKDIQWHPIFKTVNGKIKKTRQEWAEVCYVSNKVAKSLKGCEYRYLAIREELEERILPGMEDQKTLPFPTIDLENKRYKLSALVSNIDWDGEKVIHWHRERMGKSEEVHGIMKTDLAGGRFPSSDYGINAAWWWIMILALNLQTIMKQLVLGGSWKYKRMKALRYHIINIPARIIKDRGGKKYIVRVTQGHPSFNLLLKARIKIMELGWLPDG